jgi:hypothetical protein
VVNPVSYAFALHALTTNFGLAKPSTKPSESAWVKSLAGMHKLNTDASFHKNGTGQWVQFYQIVKGKL